MSDAELRKELDEERRERIWDAVEDTHSLVQQMHGTLYGNGKEGLVTTVAKNGQLLQGIVFVVGGVVLAVIGVIVKAALI